MATGHIDERVGADLGAGDAEANLEQQPDFNKTAFLERWTRHWVEFAKA